MRARALKGGGAIMGGWVTPLKLANMGPSHWILGAKPRRREAKPPVGPGTRHAEHAERLPGASRRSAY